MFSSIITTNIQKVLKTTDAETKHTNHWQTLCAVMSFLLGLDVYFCFICFQSVCSSS